MQVESILPEILKGTIHKARINSLTSLVKGIVCHKKLKLSELGRHLHLTSERSGIRIVDRVLGNTYQSRALNLRDRLIFALPEYYFSGRAKMSRSLSRDIDVICFVLNRELFWINKSSFT
ncbi:hypothetical protein SDA16_13635 [Legionella pneumophila serogroup 1]|nr:hypothetical protein [Legionella pneumophila]HCC3170260.1 hypothetical protein [Legionella pneumophila]HCC3179490.1 hypothetical protein [Legionella pneumophila]HCC3185440.1 hypothetical protein [Legionella pneumophila]HCC3188602.1 hypothetical protein [Legionella pneumophila]